MPRPGSFVIALLGAESTGKSTLAAALARALVTPANAVAPSATDPTAGAEQVMIVSEYLREFCDRHGRTPQLEEQRGIADEQTRRIDAAAAVHDLVVADTTALMTAVYSDQVFGDTRLYAGATLAHARCDMTLLMGLDLRWQADGLQRDGPQVRLPVDDKIRAALDRARIEHAVITGSGEARLQAALGAVHRAMALRASTSAGDELGADADADADIETAGPRWQWHCERCGDADCERRPLSR